MIHGGVFVALDVVCRMRGTCIEFPLASVTIYGVCSYKDLNFVLPLKCMARNSFS